MDKLIHEKEVGTACVFNADQNDIFYVKLPNSVYVDKNNNNNYKLTKHMKDKPRVTSMIATAADEYRLPVAII